MIIQISLTIILLTLIVLVGHVFRRSSIPTGLLLVITGMVLSFVPFFPIYSLNPELILNLFLPLLIFQISAFASWRDFKKNSRPIVLLSVGHVLFITAAVAYTMYTIFPSLGWPLCIILGAIVSPPDDVAIVALSEKIKIPDRVLTILEGEGIFNDATALLIFRFGLAALFAKSFTLLTSIENFVLIICLETFYGLLIGFVVGELRKNIKNKELHLIASFATPFLAYLPMVSIGGSGILSTAIVGFMIGNEYALCFTPDFRLLSRGFWPTLAFALEGLIFLLVGLNMRTILNNIAPLSLYSILLYSLSVIAVVIIGRFVWVYVFVLFLPRVLFPWIKKRDPYPPWQFPLIVSWAGLRGGVSMAAALSIPFLPWTVEGVSPRDFIIFIVFAVIIATLVVQGLTLPWLLKKISIEKLGSKEQKNEQLLYYKTRLKMAKKALQWLIEYRNTVKDSNIEDEIMNRIIEYRRLVKTLKSSIKTFQMALSDKNGGYPDEASLEAENRDAEARDERASLLMQIIEIERAELQRLWHEKKVSLSTLSKLISQLDYRVQHHLNE